MEIQTGALVIVLAYMVGMMIIGYVVGKINIKGSADYLVAGRRMGLFMVAFSLSANNIGGGSTTGLAQKAFGAWGVSAIWYVLAASLAMIPLAYFAPKIRKTMAVTIPEVVGRRFGKLSSNFTAVLSVLSAVLPDLLSNRCFRCCYQRADPDDPSERLPAAGRLRHHLLHDFRRHDRGSGFRPYPVRHHSRRSCHCNADRPEACRRLGCDLRCSAGEKLNMTQIGWASIIGYFFNYFCTFLCGPEMVSRFETCKDEKTAVRASFLCAILMAAMAIFPTLLGLARFRAEGSAARPC